MKKLLFLFALFSNSLLAQSASVIVFSYNRPMQLFAFLESSDKRCSHIEKTYVLFRSDNEKSDQGYKIVQNHFPFVSFHQEGNFKKILISLVENTPSKHIAFAVDDIIITEHINFATCIYALEKYKAWGFFLRLGKNITSSYFSKEKTPPPRDGKVIANRFFYWNVMKTSSRCNDWGYPNSLDITLYRKKDILPYIRHLNYCNPNTLEKMWARKKNELTRKKCISFLHSKIINLPLNLVNTSINNPHGSVYSADFLLDKFLENYKIDIQTFYKPQNKAPHEDRPITLIPFTSKK